MTERNIAVVEAAERILIPSGRDYEPCVEAFQQRFDIEVPEFPDRQLVVVAGGRTFARVKGKDVPEKVAAGKGDIGLTGTDACVEAIDPDRTNVAYTSIGPPMCSFDILAPESSVREILRQLSGDGEPVVVATGLPRLLGKVAAERQLRLVADADPLSGSVEAAVAMGWAKVAADVVQTGKTAKANGLISVLKLADIQPVLVWRDPDRPYVPTTTTAGICRIDTTLEERSAQVGDTTVSSYTLELLRNPNEAIKKAGQEVGEVWAAICGNGTVESCEAETADVIYALLVAARSQGKQARLENILRILTARNRATSMWSGFRPSERRDSGINPRH